MYKIVGLRNVSYTSKKTNKLVEAFDVKVEFEDRSLDAGVNIDALWISRAVLERSSVTQLAVGDNLDIRYGKDREGKAYIYSISVL